MVCNFAMTERTARASDKGAKSKPRKTNSAGNTAARSKPEYLAERAYRDLRGHIMSGRFRPGDHLAEENLVGLLGVSRSVVRQVLVQLTTEGLLVDTPKRGKTVAAFTEEDLAKLLPIRVSLEQLAVREAIIRLTDEDAAELQELAHKLKEGNLQLSEQDALDIALHRKIWKIAGNDELEKILNRVVGPFHLMGNAVLTSPLYRRTAPAVSWQQLLLERERHAGGHQLVVEAICQRDVPVAMKAMEEHLAVNYSTSPEEFEQNVSRLMRRYWHQQP